MLCCWVQAHHGQRTSLFLSDVETKDWKPEALADVARHHGRLLITQGSQGSQEWNSSGTFKASDSLGDEERRLV
jgi:hypothetical protein